ncbi:MAG: GntR family transcriptional regulator [Spirochaetaceae bacterium]|jgi:DNA-binding GntR family transcriptional regulator|nr:GntR family transcriptional regulator [Spirochaetaceae bacterium]
MVQKAESWHIIRKKLHEQVYEILRKDILEQRIGFGAKLTNRGLQERYGVSSTPVRDAINRLYLEGLLDEISQGGARVISFDYKRAVEVNEVMYILNKEAIAMSAERAVPGEVVSRLRAVLERQSEHLLSDRYYQYDQQFHRVFFDFCGNSQIAWLYNQHSGLWMLLLKFYHTIRDTRTAAISQHIRVVAAYEGGDIALVQRLMKEHFGAAEDYFKKRL